MWSKRALLIGISYNGEDYIESSLNDISLLECNLLQKKYEVTILTDKNRIVDVNLIMRYLRKFLSKRSSIYYIHFSCHGNGENLLFDKPLSLSTIIALIDEEKKSDTRVVISLDSCVEIPDLSYSFDEKDQIVQKNTRFPQIRKLSLITSKDNYYTRAYLYKNKNYGTLSFFISKYLFMFVESKGDNDFSEYHLLSFLKKEYSKNDISEIPMINFSHFE